jgi:exodeoxyribonuclease-3
MILGDSIFDCMKIATYNVNGIKSRLPNLLAWLERERPDIACLQELKAPDAGFPTLVVAGAGYKSIAKGQRYWNGVAILARGMNRPDPRPTPR